MRKLLVLICVMWGVLALGQGAPIVSSGLSTTNVYTGTNTFNGPTNLNGGGNPSGTFTGSPTFSNIVLSMSGGAIKNTATDAIIYVSTSGNDSNDGLSWGTAKLTPQAALAAVTSTGTRPGTILVSCGTFSGPTTWYQNTNIISQCAAPLGNLCGQLLCGPNNTYSSGLADTVFQYSSSLQIGSPTASLLNIYLRGVVFDFQNMGGNLTLMNIGSNVWDDVAVYRCGDTTTECMVVTTGTAAINTSFNTFNRLTINPRADSTSHYATCLRLEGTGPTLTGQIVTDNRFNEVKCVGQVNNGVDFELNSDSNFIDGLMMYETLASPPSGNATLVFNKLTPASDQDAGGGSVVTIANISGPINNFVSMGQTAGAIIISQSGAGTPTFTTLGGTPQYTFIQSALTPGTSPILQTTGRLAAGSSLAAGMTLGDISASRASTTGALYLGTDGNGFLYRNGTNTAELKVGNTIWNFRSSGTTGNVQQNIVATVGSLPACTSGAEGNHSTANNCNASCSTGGTCTAGGSTHCELYCNGSAYVETGR